MLVALEGVPAGQYTMELMVEDLIQQEKVAQMSAETPAGSVVLPVLFSRS